MRALSVIDGAFLLRWMARFEPCLPDGHVELVLPDHSAERHGRIEVPARRRNDDRQPAAIQGLEQLLQQSRSSGNDPALAEIHSGQVGSQPDWLLRTTTKTIGSSSGPLRSRRSP